MQQLDELATLSWEFGAPDYVQGGGGNTSVKTADTLWVKPSGTTLAGLTPAMFVALNRAAMQRLYQLAIPAEAAAREALVQDVMAAARQPGQTGRPSVEAPLHDLLGGAFVVHIHPALVNGLTCARKGAAACARLFPEALWVPYIDPGFSLCLDVRRRAQAYAVQRGCAPNLLLLENHGLFVTGNTPDEIRDTYRRIRDILRAEYRQAGVALALPSATPADPAAVEGADRTLRELLGPDAAGLAHAPAFAVAAGPVSPDHIVYAKSFPYKGPLTRAGLAAFRQQHGYAPMVIVTPAGVFGAGPSQKKAELALMLARDGALVQQLAAAFGGIQYMTGRASDFIEHWEVESYRQQQMG